MLALPFTSVFLSVVIQNRIQVICFCWWLNITVENSRCTNVLGIEPFRKQVKDIFRGGVKWGGTQYNLHNDQTDSKSLTGHTSCWSLYVPSGRSQREKLQHRGHVTCSRRRQPPCCGMPRPPPNS